jgi:hypothetical protein
LFLIGQSGGRGGGGRGTGAGRGGGRGGGRGRSNNGEANDGYPTTMEEYSSYLSEADRNYLSHMAMQQMSVFYQFFMQRTSL